MSFFPGATPQVRSLCFVVLIVGGVLRFWELPECGIAFYDEAAQALQARSLYMHLAASKAPPQELEAVRLPSAGKHGHVFLVTLAMLGIGPRDWSGGLVSATLGTASVYVVYRVGSLVGGASSGLLAMAFLAFSGLHIAYSREGLAEADTTFFFLLAVALLMEAKVHTTTIRSSLMLIGIAGLAAGAAILCHYRGAVYVLGLVLLMVLASARSHSPPGRRVLSLAIFMTSAAIPLLGCEMLFRLARYAQTVGDVPTYFQDLVFHYTHMAERSAVFSGSLLRPGFLAGYLHGFAQTEGLPHLGLVIIGLGVLFWQRTPVSVSIALLVLGPWIFYGLRAGGGLRYLSLTLPFLAVAKGKGLLKLGVAVGRRVPRASRWGTVVGLLAIALASSPWVAQSLEVRSPYETAMRRIEHLSPGARVVSTAYYICSFYADSAEVLFPPDSEWELYTMHQDGVRYFVIDHERLTGGYFGKVGDEGFADLTKRVRRSGRPVVAIPNPLPRYPQYILEGTVDYSVYRDLHADIHSSTEFDTLGVYDLQAYFATVPEQELRERALRDFESRLARGGEISQGRLFIYLHSLGYLLWREGEIDRAVLVYQELLDRYPGTLTAHLALGGLYEAKRDARAALHHYEEAFRVAPQSLEAKDRVERMRRILLMDDSRAVP